ncbi:hypothetical protein BO71DRAFT_398980 [Aspergillus ellipticus CBS 707.79]|uniref:Protein kinase domain-containing protein n=1 Tax=Aspergillus ellipticus CBS 707.79 TaxID=1448320 RepID=A0A319DSL0_9EURO|nr:hypothetical protein BO71DRAFT_398980 [Aspergillus ellipticus CBS 707.79]
MSGILEINLSAVEFVELVRKSKYSCIFRTRWRGRECILKVYHRVEASNADPTDRETDTFKCESNAYVRLKAYGLCDRGYVPDFYGLVKNIDPKKLFPHLKDFINDRFPPNAILLEYIPNLQKINLSTFSKGRVFRLRQILTEIHRAGIYHGDPFPRNMMIQQESNRVLWIDFDRAQTFMHSLITTRQCQWLEEENELIDYFVDAIIADHKEGRIHRTWEYYYESIYQSVGREDTDNI